MNYKRWQKLYKEKKRIMIKDSSQVVTIAPWNKKKKVSVNNSADEAFH